MNKKGKPSDEELRRAMATLGQPTTDDGALDGALETVVRAVPRLVPPKDFVDRAMLAIERAPLPEGRRVLRKSSSGVPFALAVATLVVAVGYGAIVAWGPVAARVFVRTITLVLQACVSVLVSLNSVFDLWRALSATGTAVEEALTSSDVAMVLIASALLGVLSLTALARLLSPEQESSQ